MTTPSEVIVVGAGVVGLTLAHTLLRRGLTVTVIAPGSGNHPGQATRAAGAMLSTFSESEGTHSSDVVDGAERLRAHDLWPELANALSQPEHPVSLTPGTWVLAPSGQEPALAPIVAAARRAAHPVEEHPATAVPGLMIGGRSGSALWLSTEASVDSAVLMEALTTAVSLHPQARWLTSATASATPGTVTLIDGTGLTAPYVVLAAGTAIPGLLPDHGRPFGVPPILAGRGVSGILHTSTPPPPHVVRTPNDRFACGVHLVPRADGQLYLGGTNRLTLTPVPGRAATLDEVSALLHDATTLLDHRLGGAELLSLRAGLRPYTADHLPLIGPTEAPGLWLATATYRCGILLAPRIAELIADEIDRPGYLDQHPYRATRPVAPPPLDQVLAAAGAGLLEHITHRTGPLRPAAAVQLAAFVELAMGRLLGGEQPTADVFRRLWAAAPVPEALPALYALAERMEPRR